MSMEISGLCTQNSAPQNLQPIKTEKESGINSADRSRIDNSKFDLPKDRYISHEEDETSTKGIYKMSADKDGISKIIFESPKTGIGENASSQSKKADKMQPNLKNSNEKQCKGSTDKVDSEIKRLKNQKQQLERQIRNAQGEEAEKLRQELERINGELMQKDNDSYRRQNTTFTKS